MRRGGPDRGAPPTLSSFFLLLPIAAPRCTAKRRLHSLQHPLPQSVVPVPGPSPPQPPQPPESLAATFCAVQRSGLVCPSASAAASAHLRPRPRRRGTRAGVSRRKKRRPGRAEGSSGSPPGTPAAPGLRRRPARPGSQRHGHGSAPSPAAAPGGRCAAHTRASETLNLQGRPGLSQRARDCAKPLNPQWSRKLTRFLSPATHTPEERR
ncbi:translation initiation factor IF-2-like [Pipistrellus kuhlii]|uniref:translation initiation factor IF-2-like n=1 Tax=Pipistrellus kuhlii TaxID=59472 RepID=UPI001E2710FC|nr:translation initiation factor IF-2-like [Pipistrellus kuhlii]